MSQSNSDIKDAISSNLTKMSEALSNKDAARLSSVFTEDAFMKFPGMPPLEGRNAIEKAHEQMIEQGISKLNLKTHEIESFGDLAYEVGSYELIAGEETTVDHGNYLTVWKRDGSEWKIYKDVISSAQNQES